MDKRSFIIDCSIIGILSLLFQFFKIRICIFYNAFKIPCPGCGLTRSFIYIFKGDLTSSFRYNILGIPIFIMSIIYFIFLIAEKDLYIHNFFRKHKIIFFIISMTLLFITETINIHNALLY